jgi:hypothetical protein
MNDPLQELLRSRQQFENEMYDLLVNVELLVDPSFWEPVHVKLNVNFEKENLKEPSECFICFNKYTLFNKLNCCKKCLCEGCCDTWFEKSVKCPFCNQDLRDFYD